MPRNSATLWVIVGIVGLILMQSMGGRLGAQLRSYPTTPAPLGSFAGQHGDLKVPNVCRDGNFDNDPPSCSK